MRNDYPGLSEETLAVLDEPAGERDLFDRCRAALDLAEVLADDAPDTVPDLRRWHT